jgi:polysaccharide biosynthesis transport protein
MCSRVFSQALNLGSRLPPFKPNGASFGNKIMNAETENVLSPRAVTETWDASEPEFRRVRRKLSLGFRYSYVLRFFTGFCIVVAASAIAWPFLPRRYESTATIILRPADAETSSESTQFMRQPLEESAIQSEIDRIASPALVWAVITQHQLAADPEFNGGVISWLKQRLFGQSSASEIDLRRRVLERLTVSRERRSYTVKFGFRSSDRFKAAAMAETLFKAYLADQLERKRELIANLAGRLSERTDRLLAKWVSSQRAVTDFLVR